MMNVKIMRGDQTIHNTNPSVNLITDGYGLSKNNIMDIIEFLPEESRDIFILNNIRIKLTKIVASMYSALDKNLLNEYSIINSIDRIMLNCGLNNSNIRKSFGPNNIYTMISNELFCIGFNLYRLSKIEFADYLDSISNDVYYISEIASL